jgi:tripartite-type tricarboxylate transporter receptor subunit TctC
MLMKKNDNRETGMNGLWAAAAALLISAGLNGARAEDYPARTVTVIVPFAAGGPADITGRIVADIFPRHLGQKFVVENVGGAGGTIGALHAARAAPDGYTILSGHVGTNALAAAFYPNLGYDPLKDFEPIGISAEYPELLVVRKNFPANNLKEFVAYAKANEAKLNVGHAGLGSVSYIGCLLLHAAIGIKPAMVPFTGTAPVLNAMLGGEIDYECDPVLGTLEHVRAGTVKALAVAARKRSSLLPDVPTSYEQGLQNSIARRSMRCSRRQARQRPSWKNSPTPSTRASTSRPCKSV